MPMKERPGKRLPAQTQTVLQPVSKRAQDVAEHGIVTLMKRLGEPEEVAPAFVFFASNADSSYITGEVLTLLGGETTAA
jgi:NAD(P)-dependent dehydrogenase (short-subunit alcohol dehydrogenase family)